MILNRIQLYPDLYNFIIFIIIFFLFVILLFYFLKGNESFSDTWIYLRILIVSIIFVLFLLIFSYEILVIYITIGIETGSESWIFVILISLLIGVYMNVVGIHLEKDGNGSNIKFVILFVLIYLSLSGLGYLGILIEIRKPISNYLMYRFFQTNSTHGIWFMFYNLSIFIVIFFISFIVEKEKK